MSKEELEIKEANELRAKLGLKPLKPWNLLEALATFKWTNLFFCLQVQLYSVKAKLETFSPWNEFFAHGSFAFKVDTR